MCSLLYLHDFLNVGQPERTSRTRSMMPSLLPNPAPHSRMVRYKNEKGEVEAGTRRCKEASSTSFATFRSALGAGPREMIELKISMGFTAVLQIHLQSKRKKRRRVVKKDKEVGLEMCEVGVINREKHYSGRVVFLLE